MPNIKTLPLQEGTKLIVLDEGTDAMYARKLIAGWIQMFGDKDPSRKFDLLLFSNTKSIYQNESTVFLSDNVSIWDHCNVDTNKFHINDIGEQDFHHLQCILNTVNKNSTIILDCLTSLILFVGLPKGLWFLERLRNSALQIICIYRHDLVQDKVPCIEALGNAYVTIEKFTGPRMHVNCCYITEFTYTKIGVSVLKQKELVIQDNKSYNIQSEKLEPRKEPNSLNKSLNKKVEASFRIEINENEMKQRKNIVLPYTINHDLTNTSKIHYQLEDVDDADEEDPDDDLCI